MMTHRTCPVVVASAVLVVLGCGGSVAPPSAATGSSEPATPQPERSVPSGTSEPAVPDRSASALGPDDATLTEAIGPVRIFGAGRFRMRFPREISAGEGPTGFQRAARPNGAFIVTFVDVGPPDPLSFERLREFVETHRNGRIPESEIEIDLGGRRALRTHYAVGGPNDLRETVIAVAVGSFAFQVVVHRPEEYPDELAVWMAGSLERASAPRGP